MNGKLRIVINFPEQSPNVRERLANDLAKAIRRSVKDGGRPVQPSLERSDGEAQDFGSTVVLVLGTPAITMLAKAILEWVKLSNASTIALNGVRIDTVRSQDVAAVVAALGKGSVTPGNGSAEK